MLCTYEYTSEVVDKRLELQRDILFVTHIHKVF
uniref:Uncharacterized protein n=1 Tax=Anguilla anguilla TaxID=7936 RepID=A0A0E9W091_ANGAN